MAKKKSHKKHQFKYTEPGSSAQNTPPAAVLTNPAKSVPGGLQSQVPNLDLIKGDIRKVIILASSFVIVELVLWLAFNNSGLGSAVYRIIHV